MPGCPIIRIEKHKNASSLMGAMGHHARTIPTPNADPKRLHDNQVLWGADQPREIARLVSERTDQLVKRKDAVRSVELFLGASDEFWESGGDWQQLGRAHLAMLRREFGESNIIGMGVHLDERRPHFWAVITPVTPEGKLSASHWFDGPAKLAKLLDRAQVDFEPLAMERARRGVKATHVDMQTIHDANAGNPRAQTKLINELGRREAEARKRLEATEAAASDAEVRLARARAEAAEIEAKAAEVAAKQRQADAKEAKLMVWQQRLERLEKRVNAMQESLIQAFGELPGNVQSRLAKIFGLEQATQAPAPSKKRVVEASNALPSVSAGEDQSPERMTPNRGSPEVGKVKPR